MHDSQFSGGQGANDQCLLFQFLVDFGSNSWLGIWVNETSLKTRFYTSSSSSFSYSKI
jgi:hypothetical protein